MCYNKWKIELASIADSGVKSLEFRPCIDLHSGKVKQIVGETLGTEGKAIIENFVSSYDSKYYAAMFKKIN